VTDSVVDPAWLAKEVAAITAELERVYPHSAPGAVNAAVREAARRLSPNAKTPTFLPILIRRTAGDMLSDAAAMHAQTAPEA
jgi:hypothetical protein